MRETSELEQITRRIRRRVVEMIGAAASGHPGGSLSAVEILAVLYFEKMRLDPAKPQWEERDRFILAKGHAAPALYATLALRGYFPEQELPTLRQYGSILQGHPDMRKTPGVDASTGSLGQGLSLANGLALAAKLDGKSWRVYTLLGDGEQEEGQVWEAAMTAAHYRLDNLTAFTDYNRLQIDGCIEDVKLEGNLAARWEAFGWRVEEIDGHDFAAIRGALARAEAHRGQPTMIIAHTIKGKGISFMENEVGWHGTAPKPEQVAQAVAELGGGD